MLHLRIATSPEYKSQNMSWNFMPLRLLAINDSYYFALSDDFENLEAEKKTTSNFLLILKEYILELCRKITKIQEGISVFFPIDLYDEYQGGILFEHQDENTFNVSAVYTLAIAGYEVKSLKDSIRVISLQEKEKLEFQIQVVGGRVDKKTLYSSVHKAANNIELVDNFGFLFTWK